MTKSVILVLALMIFSFAWGFISPKSVLSKKGKCAIVDESDHDCNREFVTECLVDFDCNGTTKCCRTTCHQHRCIEPVDLEQRMCHRFSNIAFVLDASGSIGEESFEKSKRMIKKILKAFPHEKGHRHAAVLYGKKPSLVFNSISSQDNAIRTEDLLDRIDRITYLKSTMTRINVAIRLVEEKIFPSFKIQNDRAKIIVVFTDGIQSAPPYKEALERAGKRLDGHDIKVFGVLTGEERNIDALLKLCSNDQLIFEPDFITEMIKDMNAEMEYPC